MAAAKPITVDDIAKLRALCDAATPGPWEASVWLETDGSEWRATGPGHEDLASDEGCEPGCADEHAAQRDAAFIVAARNEVPALLDEIERLRTTLAHSCTCSLADGAAPALRHEQTCELRIAKTKRIDPALALSRFAAAMDACTEAEVEELKAKLAAMTDARDEACDLAECIVGEPPARIAELRAVGNGQSPPAEKWAACEEPPSGDGVPACGWTGEMSMLVDRGNGVLYCPNCGSTAIREDIDP